MTPRELREKNRAHFVAFWAAYPRQKSVNEAERVFSEIVESGVDPTYLIQQAQAYARNVNPSELEYVPYPHRWLRDGCYEDSDLFTDQARHEKEWLRGCYQRCDVSAVEERYQIKMPRMNIPEGVSGADAVRQWYRRKAQDWILEVGKQHGG